MPPWWRTPKSKGIGAVFTLDSDFGVYPTPPNPGDSTGPIDRGPSIIGGEVNCPRMPPGRRAVGSPPFIAGSERGYARPGSRTPAARLEGQPPRRYGQRCPIDIVGGGCNPTTIWL